MREFAQAKDQINAEGGFVIHTCPAPPATRIKVRLISFRSRVARLYTRAFRCEAQVGGRPHRAPRRQLRSSDRYTPDGKGG